MSADDENETSVTRCCPLALARLGLEVEQWNGLLFHCRFSALLSPAALLPASVSEGLPWDGE